MLQRGEEKQSYRLENTAASRYLILGTVLPLGLFPRVKTTVEKNQTDKQEVKLVLKNFSIRLQILSVCIKMCYIQQYSTVKPFKMQLQVWLFFYSEVAMIN